MRVEALDAKLTAVKVQARSTWAKAAMCRRHTIWRRGLLWNFRNKAVAGVVGKFGRWTDKL